jgi:hypothetical protein
LALYAREVTYFDPMREKRSDGFDAMQQALEPIKGLVFLLTYAESPIAQQSPPEWRDKAKVD